LGNLVLGFRILARLPISMASSGSSAPGDGSSGSSSSGSSELSVDEFIQLFTDDGTEVSQRSGCSADKSFIIPRRLKDAIVNGEVVEVDKCLQLGVEHAEYMLHLAVAADQIGVVTYLIQKKPVLMKKNISFHVIGCDYLGGTPLHTAVTLQQVHTVKVLLSQWKNPNMDIGNDTAEIVRRKMEEFPGWYFGVKHPTPIYMAIRADNLDMVKLLIKAGVDPEGATSLDSPGYTPLEAAIDVKAAKCRDYLIEKLSAEGRQVSSKVLTLAMPDIDLLAILLRNFQQVPISSETMGFACFDVEAMRLLVATGRTDRSINRECHDYITPLMMVACLSSIDDAEATGVARLMLHARADPSVKRFAKTPLEWANYHGKTALAALLSQASNKRRRTE